MLFLILLLFFLLFYEPIFGRKQFLAFERSVQIDPTRRLPYYYTTMLALWLPTVYLLAVVYWQDIPWRELGLKGFDFSVISNPPVLNRYLVYVLCGMVIGYLGGALANLLMMKNPKFQERMRNEMRKDQNSYLKALHPYTRRERIVWIFVSLTAGITEELLYRSFLLYFLPLLIPDLPLAVYIVLSSLIFGLGHTYQGLTGVLKTGTIGAAFALLYLAFDSIIPVMILHAIMDVMILPFSYASEHSTTEAEKPL